METRRVGKLDLLRFLAAMSVTVFHLMFRGFAADDFSKVPYPLLAPVAKYGFLGVELFFIISGFVILMTASRGNLKHFAISRITRLYPTFWVCCTLTFVAILLIGGERFSASPGQYLANLTMMGGFTDVAPLDGAYWSLFVELKFYALVALILLFRQLERTQLLLALWLSASVLLNIFPVRVLNLVFIQDYAPLFIGGAICYLIYARGVSLPRLTILGVACAAAVHHALGAVPGFEQKFRTDLNEYVIAGAVTGMFATLLLIALNRTGWLAKTKWVALGALTYPLYLIHQNIGYMLFNLAYPALNPHVLVWGTVALFLVCAHLIDRFVEQRCTRQLKRALEVGLGKIQPTHSGRPLEAGQVIGQPGYGRLGDSSGVRGGGRVTERARGGPNPLSRPSPSLSRPSNRPYKRAEQTTQRHSKP